MSYWQQSMQMMSSEDLNGFVKAIATTFVIGVSILIYFFMHVNRKVKESEARQQRTDEQKKNRQRKLAPDPNADPVKMREQREQAAASARAAAAKRKKQEAAAAREAGTEEKGENAAAGGLPGSNGIKRVPLAASKAVVDRGNRLLKENKNEDALACFLSLLYSVAEEGGELPPHLCDTLRGAAQSYRALGRADLAVRFLQAERRVYEEMLAAATQSGKKSSGATNILASLLNPEAAAEAAEEDSTDRFATLSRVADACSKQGNEDVALAYRVKAAALKQKVTGKAMDPESKEFRNIAESLSKLAPKVEEREEEAARNAAESEAAEATEVGRVMKEEATDGPSPADVQAMEAEEANESAPAPAAVAEE